MTIADMIGQSGTVSLLGMSIVFGFLVIMVITISVLGKIINSFKSEKNISAVSVTAAEGGSKPISANNGDIIAAISVAVNKYRKSN